MVSIDNGTSFLTVDFAETQKTMQKPKENYEKGLTRGEKSGILCKHSKRALKKNPIRPKAGKASRKRMRKNPKKLLENPLTNGKKSDIIIERPKRGSKKIPLLGKSGSRIKG